MFEELSVALHRQFLDQVKTKQDTYIYGLSHVDRGNINKNLSSVFSFCVI